MTNSKTNSFVKIALAQVCSPFENIKLSEMSGEKLVALKKMLWYFMRY